MRRGREIGKASPKEECMPVTDLMKKLIQDYRMVFLPLGRNNAKGTNEMLPLCVERIS